MLRVNVFGDKHTYRHCRPRMRNVMCLGRVLAIFEGLIHFYIFCENVKPFCLMIKKKYLVQFDFAESDILINPFLCKSLYPHRQCTFNTHLFFCGESSIVPVHVGKKTMYLFWRTDKVFFISVCIAMYVAIVAEPSILHVLATGIKRSTVEVAVRIHISTTFRGMT